ncbi:MAG: putative lipoprotein [Methylococcales bacterium]|nr:putative lipoprotein [Methylococcaceae bacterium]
MFISNRKSLLLVSVCCLLFLNACSFSNSSESSSDSSGSISDSSSSVSSSGGSAKYESDVEDYTYAYIKSTSGDTDYSGFKKGLSEIAEKRGISDWESDAHTYKAMGKALKKAHIEGVGYETFQKNFADADPKKMKQIQQGYDSRD